MRTGVYGWRRYGLGLALGLLASAGAHAAGLHANFLPDHDRLEVRIVDATGGPYELRLLTPGIRDLESGAEVKETGPIYLPPPEDGATAAEDAELFFFFHDAPHGPEWELVFDFPEGVSGNWILNGRSQPLRGRLATEVTVPAGKLLEGENLFYFRSPSRELPRLYYRRAVRAADEVVNVAVHRDEWSAQIDLVERQANGEVVEVDTAAVSGRRFEKHTQPRVERPWEDHGMIEEAALAVGQNILAARVTDEGSRFADGFHLVYDRVRNAHRISHWLWSWGPSIKLLFQLEDRLKQRDPALAGQFREAAIAAARRSLDFGVIEPDHPARGVSRVRWEVSRATPDGWAEYISTADSLFLAGWGWMSAYEETGDAIFLERTRTLVDAAERLMAQYPVVPQDWIVERDRWTPHTLDESVFGMIGFRELYEETGDRATAALGRRFLDSHLRHMSRGSGLLERAWLREEDRAIWDPDIKGHAWVVEGYLDAYALSGEQRYLELARELAAKVMECQRPDGSWSYLFTPPNMEEPADDKGTAIWAYFFYVLHETTRDPEHLAAARRALTWCLRHQYRGEDPNLVGGLLTDNGMAYVRQRPMTILYSTTFFGLALLEELKLSTR